MAEVTVRQLAKQVGIPVDRLLLQLGESGLPHSDADEAINENDRAQLLTHLRRLQLLPGLMHLEFEKEY